MKKNKLICKYCGREAPNKDFLRGDKCIACDADYYFKKIDKQEKDNAEKEKN